MTKEDVIKIAFSRNIETSKIPDGLIEAVQVKRIRRLIGDDFYDALIASPSSYSELIPLIEPVLAFHVALVLLPRLHTEIGNVGIVHLQGRNRTQTDDYEDLKQHFIDMSKLYTDVLGKFLDDNSDNYPLYYLGGSPMERIVEAGGILFKKRNLWEDDTFYTDDDDYTIYLNYL